MGQQTLASQSSNSSSLSMTSKLDNSSLSSPFLRLPSEIRMQIYSHVLETRACIKPRAFVVMVSDAIF